MIKFIDHIIECLTQIASSRETSLRNYFKEEKIIRSFRDENLFQFYN